MLESSNNRLSALLGLSCREENAKANFAEIFDFHSRCSNGRSRFCFYVFNRESLTKHGNIEVAVECGPLRTGF